MVEKEYKYGLLILLLEQPKYGNVIGNPMVQWTTCEDPGGFDDTIQAKDSAFDRSKGEKKMVIEYEKFLGVEESIRTLLLQAVEEPYLEVVKAEYIRYGGRITFEMIAHLRTRISKVTNCDKVPFKKEIITWEQPQVL